jgi:hypothetical protein
MVGHQPVGLAAWNEEEEMIGCWVLAGYGLIFAIAGLFSAWVIHKTDRGDKGWR